MYPYSLLPLASLFSLLSSTSARCSNFTSRHSIQDTSFTIPDPSTLRVSAAINCSNPATLNIGIEGPDSALNQQCNASECALYMPGEYYARLNRSLNISTSSVDVTDNIFGLISSLGYFQTGESVNLNQTWVYGISQVSTCLEQGEAGYWGFTPTLRCVDGVLSGCDADDSDPTDDTAIRACGVEMYQDGWADGTLAVVMTSGWEVDSPSPANATLTKHDKNQRNGAGATKLVQRALTLTVAAVVLAMLV